MKLDDAQQAIIKEKLSKAWHEPRACPLCKSQELMFSDTVFSLSEFSQYGLLTDIAEVPVIPYICYNCGYVMLFNAICLKIIEGGGSNEQASR